jgi:hypothetical protein
MPDIVPLVADGQAAPSLDELAKRVRDAHASLIHAASNAVMYAINAGQALIAAKAQKDRIPHGQWGKFLKRCDVGARRAERYMRLARLAESNPTCKSDLAGLTIEAAIKKLSPLKPGSNFAAPRAINDTRPTPGKKSAIVELTSLAWSDAPAPARTRFVDGVGLQALYEAAQADQQQRFRAWLLRQDEPAVEQAAPEGPNIPDDLGIPQCLRREPAPKALHNPDDSAFFNVLSRASEPTS